MAEDKVPSGGLSGTPDNPIPVTDPQVLRALSHSARIAIWYHLVLDGPATATECAVIADLSPSACSYHLRALERYGFVEEDTAHPRDGRERPWRAKIAAVSVSTGKGTPAQRAAGRLMVQSVGASVDELRESYHDREPEYPDDWQEALGVNYDVLHVTPEELETLKRRIVELAGEYRRLDRDSRPPGSRRVHLTVDLIPWFPPEAAGQDQPE
jgi:DNA-binding transcriptional ArsR family regulator